jgi:cell division protein FtsI/penicillin-binding protein 2
MLEQARFSLARAGVMVGLCGLVVLGAGWVMNSREAVKTQAPVHFSARTWEDVQGVLRHVVPNASGQATSFPALSSPGCTPAQPGHERLQKAVESLNLHLHHLTRAQFVKQTYRLDVAGFVLEPGRMGQTCTDMLRPIQWLNDRVRRQGLAFLQALAWKERSSASAQARFEPHVWVALPKQMLTSRSAWSGLPGCLYGSDAMTGQRVVVDRGDSAALKLCQSQVAAQQALRSPLSLWDHVPGLSSLTEPLSAWRLPQHAQYSERVGDDNQVMTGGQKQTVGLHVQLSLDPAWQAWLQELAGCFSGQSLPACARYAMQAEGRYEKARVRMAGIAVVDVPTGRLVAAASADSPCHAHDKTRVGQPPADCPVLPENTVHRPRVPQAVTNHALFTQAPPGSLVKPLLMAGIVLHTPAEAGLNGLEQALQRSDSQQFLDAFLCRQKLGQGGFSPRCDRPALTQQTAHRLGWNSGCDALSETALSRCGMVDLMHGMPLTFSPQHPQTAVWRPSVLPVLMGQTLVRPERSASGVSGYRDMSWPDSLPSVDQRKACASSGGKGYVRCGGPQMGLVSEAYGQGNTLTTPTGVAGLLATLANSAQGQAAHYPHVLVDMIRADGHSDPDLETLQRMASSQKPEGIDPVVARRVLAAMEKTLMPAGTAHAACARAFGTQACLAVRGVAGKTGTPGDADERSLSQLAQDMRARAQCQASTTCVARYPLPRPRYRWYAAVFKSQGSDQYDKAIAVLVHSNWRRSDGRYADDQNAAAEMAMLAIRQFQTTPDKP